MRFAWIGGFFFFLAIINGCASVPITYSDRISGRIARQFHVGEEKVSELLNKGYQNEEVVKILIVSVATNITIDDVVKMREIGQSWPEICQDLGVDISTFNRESEYLSKKIGFSKGPS